MMKFERYPLGRILFPIVAVLMLAGPSAARANVYASNVRLNGGTTNSTVVRGTPVTIDYILNEPASLGVTIKVLSGATVVRTLAIPSGNSGTQLGANTVTWDGLDASSNVPPLGTYSISIDAASAGYSVWTPITDDDNNYLLDGRGIAVDRNPTSPYYGRIFVANAYLGSSPGTTYGDNLGILVFNADASIADPNIPVDGGYNWSDNDVSPWKIKVSSDDFVYASEAVNGGRVYRWDPNLTTNSFVAALRSDNRPANASLSGPFIAGSGTNTQIWMCDTNPGTSLGVLKWLVGTNGACAANDTGRAIIGVGGSLTVAPYDVALDPAGNIYVCQYTGTPGDPVPRVFRFKAYDPSTNGNAPELTADWAVGGGDDTYGAASGIAVDPTGTYVAVAFFGAAPGNLITNGNTRILYATNGALVTNLDLGIPVKGTATHQDSDCAWDAAGNVYYIDTWAGVWRAISPPGANHSTTLAPATVQTSLPTRPLITSVGVTNGIVTLNFTGAASDPAEAFALQSSGRPGGTYTNAANASIVQTGTGLFRATVPVNGPVLFYRLQR